MKNIVFRSLNSCILYALSFTVLIIMIFLFFISAFAIDAECVTGDCDSNGQSTEPKLLEDFSYGCYGIDNDASNILIREDEARIGNLFLIDDEGVKKIILCKTEPIGYTNHITVSEYFINSDLSGDTSYAEYFSNKISSIFGNDYDGQFFISVVGESVFLSKSNAVSYFSDDLRYKVQSLSLKEFNDDETEKYSASTPQSFIFGIKEVTANKSPVLVSPSQYINTGCSASTVCVFQSNINIYEGDSLSHTFEARDVDPYNGTDSREISYEFESSLSFGDSEFADFNDYFEFDTETRLLSQKEGVVLEKSKSPYTVKLTLRESPVNGDDKESTRSFQPLHISVINRSQGVVSTSTPSPTIISVVSSGGGRDQLVVDRLKGSTPTATPTPTPAVLVCPSQTYYRYPEKRGGGVDSALFQDTNESHRAYAGLIDLAEQEIVNGDNESGDARLDEKISRAEFVKIMTIARQDTLLLGDCLKFSNFTDVPETEWFTPFVQNLEQKNIVKGYTDNRYRPGQSINLVEAYKIIALSFDYISIDEAHKIVHDQNIHWYVPYVTILQEGNVIPEWMSGYAMNEEISRGDMFALLSNVLRQKDWLENIDWQ